MIVTLAIISKTFNWVHVLVCLIFIGFSHQFACAQDSKNLLLLPDSSWGKEVFNFPLTFAPEIKYRGYEEAWFPKAWLKKDSASFSSYSFPWSIDRNKPIALKDMQQNLKDYFDGLMRTKIDASTKAFHLPLSHLPRVQKQEPIIHL